MLWLSQFFVSAQKSIDVGATTFKFPNFQNEEYIYTPNNDF